jgi:hypothetical protein
MVLFHVTLQANPVPSLPQAAVKTARMRVDTQSTFLNGCMALNTDGVCPVIMAASTGVNFAPGDTAMEVRVSGVSKARRMWLCGKVSPNPPMCISDAFATMAFPAKSLAMTAHTVRR